MDENEVRQQFADTGVIRLDGAFATTEAGAMRDAVWHYADGRYGVRRDEPSTWPEGWSGIGWKDLRRSRVFDPFFGNEAVTSALRAIFGESGWMPPRAGTQLLVTFPEPGPWTLPESWHIDCGFEVPTWPVFAVKLFGFFDSVGAEGGGTLLLPGSHRVVERYRQTLPPDTGGGKQNWQRFLRHDPWLAELLDGAGQPDHGRSRIGLRHEVDGLPVEVMELTGEPGDVVLTHLHVFHSTSPNTAGRPRQMMGKEIRAART